mgnify:CR=1 FL=1
MIPTNGRLDIMRFIFIVCNGKRSSEMKKYDDEITRKGLYLYFILYQIVMLLIVYATIYTSFVATGLAVSKYDLTFMMYLPALLSLAGYPIVLYRTRKLFLQEKRLRAVVWVMGWAWVIIIGLYWHLSHITTL